MAIATVTAALRDRLREQIARIAPDLADLVVTARSPDQARRGCTAPQLNLFLLNASVDQTMRNHDRLGGQEEEKAALGVTAHYLLTAYGREADDEDDLVCHRVLGAAMSVMHGSLLFDDAAIGPLRVSHKAMTALDAAALWSSFQMPYRVSAAYEVGVIPIHAR